MLINWATDFHCCSLVLFRPISLRVYNCLYSLWRAVNFLPINSWIFLRRSVPRRLLGNCKTLLDTTSLIFGSILRTSAVYYMWNSRSHHSVPSFFLSRSHISSTVIAIFDISRYCGGEIFQIYGRNTKRVISRMFGTWCLNVWNSTLNVLANAIIRAWGLKFRLKMWIFRRENDATRGSGGKWNFKGGFSLKLLFFEPKIYPFD